MCDKGFIWNPSNCNSVNPNLLSIDKISKKMLAVLFMRLNILKIFIKNSLYLLFNNVDAYIEYNTTEDDSETKYLAFASTDKN